MHSRNLLSLLILSGLWLADSHAYEFTYVGPSGKPGYIFFTQAGFPNGLQSVNCADNPIIQGDNVYAPDLLRVGNAWRCYYGGWATYGQGNDKIYLGISDDFEPIGSWSRTTVISNGVYVHVNDPTVVQAGPGVWHMLFTAARFIGQDYRDWINYATSSDGLQWSPSSGSVSTEIVLNDPLNIAGGPMTDIARPSLVKDDGLWRLWFDGKVSNGSIRSYYAEGTEPEPFVFTLKYRYLDVNGFPGFMEPDVVKRKDGTFLAVIQRNFNDLYIGTSSTGQSFILKKALDADHPMFKRKYVSNPGLLYDQVMDNLLGLSFGMTDNDGLTDHDIGFSYQQYIIEVESPGSVWHVDAESRSLQEQSISVGNTIQFEQVRLKDPNTAIALYSQDFSNAANGDRWTLRNFPTPTPSSTPSATPTPTPILGQVEHWSLSH